MLVQYCKNSIAQMFIILKSSTLYLYCVQLYTLDAYDGGEVAPRPLQSELFIMSFAYNIALILLSQTYFYGGLYCQNSMDDFYVLYLHKQFSIAFSMHLTGNKIKFCNISPSFHNVEKYFHFENAFLHPLLPNLFAQNST